LKSRALLPLILICFCLQNHCYSQRKFKRFNYIDGLSITPKIGLASVIGELGDVFSLKPTFGLNIENGLSEKVNLGIELIGGKLVGSENSPYFSSFQCEYFQIKTQSSWNISRYFSSKNFEYKVYGGVGMIWFHTNVFDLKTNNFLRTTADGTTRHTALFQPTGYGIGDQGIYYTRELVIPVGIMLRYEFNENFGLVYDMGYNWVFNDKLDGTTPYNLGNPNIIGGVNSYSDTANDGWINISIGFQYRFRLKSSENQRGV
jgi:hypothetical protein